MTTAFTSIPVIDIQALVRNKDNINNDDVSMNDIITKLDDACKHVGFFYVKGHGISQKLLNDVLDVSHEFFNRPYDEKFQIKMTAATGYRGYQNLGENVTKGTSDWHEAIDYFREFGKDGPSCVSLLGKCLIGPNQWPQNPKHFKELMEKYINEMRGLARIIMQSIALALGGPRDSFEGERAGDPFWIMRVIGYPPMDSICKRGDVGIGCEAHTDYGLLTLVNQDPDIQALQVKNNSGEWIWAPPIPGTFVVNIGDMLEIWSNGQYKPTIHRVINNSKQYRVSVPFFYEPNFEAKVEPLDFCLLTDGKPLYGPAIYGDHVPLSPMTGPLLQQLT